MFTNASAPNASAKCLIVHATAEPRCVRGALIRDGLKLVVGPEAQNDWYGAFSPNVTTPTTKHSPWFTEKACLPSAPCLFDLNASMTEHEDVASLRPDALADMLARFADLANEYHPPMHDPPLDLPGLMAAVALNGGFVGPWMAEPIAPPDGWVGEGGPAEWSDPVDY
jgi:hypothetical protein